MSAPPIKAISASLTQSSRAKSSWIRRLQNIFVMDESNSLADVRQLRIESLESRQLMAVDLAIDSASYATDRVLIQVNPAITNSLSSSLSQISSDVATITKLGESGWVRLGLNAGASVSGAMQRLQALSGVLTVSPDFRITQSALPNDTMYVNQWPLSSSATAMGAPTAWSNGTGSSSIIVGVIDTGIDYTHPDLAANIWSNSREIAGNGIDDDGNGYRDDTRGWNFVSNNNNPMDDNGHGTHVAGTIGAVGNNGLGIAGVAWNVKLMPLKFMDSSGAGYLSDAVSAVDYARVNGAKIINASFGGGGFSSAMQSAIQRFQQAGGIFVAAAGNESANNALVASYPANYSLSNVISVAATTSSGTLASFSNYGTNVDIAAPGQNILSTLPGGRYGAMSGTSMAAPHVAGALALLWSQSSTISASQLISALIGNTDSALRDKTIYGRMNLGKASSALLVSNGGSGDTVAPFVESAQWVNDAARGAVDSVILDFSENMDIASVASSLVARGPSGPVTIGSVTASTTDPTKLVIKLTGATTQGTYRIDLSPNAKDLAGNKLNQDRDAAYGESTQDAFSSQWNFSTTTGSYTSATNIALADATSRRAGVTSIPINVDDTKSITNISVEVSINHTYASDLRIRLISPTGNSVMLVNRRGGSTDNMRLTLSDSATSSIATASTLSGSFRPEQALSTFVGRSAAGRWILEVTDLATADAGMLNIAKLNITTSPNASSPSSSSGTNAGSSNGSALDALQRWIDSLFRRRS